MRENQNMKAASKPGRFSGAAPCVCGKLDHRPAAPLPLRASRITHHAVCSATLLLALTLTAALAAAELDLSKLPPPASATVDYERDVKPIFESACFRCHGPEKPKSHFRLDNRASALKGGDNGVDILPGQSSRSPLIHYVARLVPDLEMPPGGKGQPLSPEQIGLLRAWIDQGAPYPESDTNIVARTLFSATSTVRWVGVSGNSRKFREHAWLPDGGSGGIEAFDWQEPLGNGKKFRAEGHALVDAHDYRLRLSYEKDEVGFIRGGFEEFRKWYDDGGGYYEPFAAPPMRLGRDLYLDTGRAWIEAGLAAPDYPRMTLGYEHQYRQGTKSTLEWGWVSDPIGGETRAIYPASKDLDEQVHLVKFDLSHEVGGVLFEDNFRGEFYESNARRYNADATLGLPVPDLITRYTEDYQHFHGANALRLERQLRDWLFVSGGYLYSRLDGTAEFTSTWLFSDPTIPSVSGDFGPAIILTQQSHVFNANSQLGPWAGLTLSGGVQSEWRRQEGFGAAYLGNPPLPIPMSANLDRFANNEQFALRYTKIPFTVLYAETRFEQESLGQFESSVTGDLDSPAEFLRDTRARADWKEYRFGFNLSPWQPVSLHASYKSRLGRSDYDHRTDLSGSSPSGDGYPAFILARQIEADEIEAKLVLHPLRWLKTTLKYQIVATDYLTETAPLDDGSNSNIRVGGGQLRAGIYDAHISSLSGTVTPWRRLYFTTTFAFTDSRVRSGMDNGGTLVPYRGDIFTALESATFALDQKTDLQMTYSFSRADYGQGNSADALPLGLEYDRHGLLAGLTRRFKKNLTASLQYGFFRYREPSAGRASDYDAHAIFASLTAVLP